MPGLLESGSSVYLSGRLDGSVASHFWSGSSRGVLMFWLDCGESAGSVLLVRCTVRGDSERLSRVRSRLYERGGCSVLGELGGVDKAGRMHIRVHELVW